MENIENKSLETQVEDQAKETTTEQTPKTYTEEEVQKMIDRRVTQAMETAERKNKARVKEAEKLAKMNEQEKYEYELSQREAAIAAKEKELALAENRNVASKILADKGLSLALVDFIVAEDADTMNSNINVLEKAFKQSVKAEVEKRLAGNTPKKNLPLDKPIDKKQFAGMGYEELMQLRINNPELFAQFKNS